MIKNVSKTAIMLSVCLIQTFSMFADDKEMHDNYKPINISVEPTTNPHRSLTPDIVAYYYMKEVVLEMSVPLDEVTVEIVNTESGMIKVETLETKDYNSSINISEMGIGSYVIYITINSNLRFIGTLELY